MTDKMHINWDIIVRRILGEGTEEENRLVEEWFTEDKKNREYYLKAKRYFDLYYTGEEIREKDMESAWDEFVHYSFKSSRKVSWKTLAKYAAVLLLSLCVGFTYWFLEEMPEETITLVKSTSIESGSKKATLVCNTGEQVVLTDTSVFDNVLMKVKNKIVGQGIVDSLNGNMAYHTVVVPKGGEYNLTLPDGTGVMINADSKLSIPEEFTGRERRVRLEGEALFQVTKDTERPFVVETGSGEVKVLGTVFNLNAYLDEEFVQTTLVSGKVAFQAKGMKVAQVIVPGEQVTYDKYTRESRVMKVNPATYTAWTEGKWIIEGERLENIMKQLSRWYDVTVFYQNPEAKNLIFTGDLEKYAVCGVVLDIIAMTTNVEFVVNDRVITVKMR